jgi:hypothetical protein
MPAHPMDEKIMKKKSLHPREQALFASYGANSFFMIFSSIGGAGVQFEYTILTLAT